MYFYTLPRTQAYANRNQICDRFRVSKGSCLKRFETNSHYRSSNWIFIFANQFKIAFFIHETPCLISPTKCKEFCSAVLFLNLEFWFTFLHIWRCFVLFHHVLPKIAGVFGREVVLITLERLLFRMRATVSFQISSISAWIVTLTTLKRLFSCVMALV